MQRGLHARFCHAFLLCLVVSVLFTVCYRFSVNKDYQRQILGPYLRDFLCPAQTRTSLNRKRSRSFLVSPIFSTTNECFAKYRSLSDG